MFDFHRILGRFRYAKSGSVAIITALVFPILVGGMALGTEASYWYLSQRKLQQTGDFAAYAAAVQLRSGRPEANMRQSANTVAASSGLRARDDTLTLSHPPTTGNHAGASNAVEIRLERQQVRYFSLIYSTEPVRMTARAVAAVRGGSDACLLALDPRAGGAITIGGSANIIFNGCDVATNSTASDAFAMNGGSAEMTAGCLHSVGGVDATSNLTLQDCDKPRVEAPPVLDPYASLAEPPVAGSCAASNSIGSNNATTRVTPSQALDDGTPMQRYCGGLLVRGKVNFEPGLYIVDGGEFRVNAGTVVTGDDVTFLLVNGATLAFNGGAQIDLSAPTTGSYAGLLFFGSRMDTGADHTINGSAGSTLNGAVYLPSGILSYSGNFGGSGGCVQIVARQIVFGGNSELVGGCSAAGTRRIAVAEMIALVE